MNDALTKAVLPCAMTIIIALIAALWVNLTGEISDLKAEVRGVHVEISDTKMEMMEMKGRYDKLVDIFNQTATKKK